MIMKPPVRGKFIFSLVLLLGVSMIFGMDWPAREGVLVNNFGWNNRGYPVLGASFAVEGPIHAADAGELIFAHSISHTASRLPSPLGAWAAFDHGDSLIGIYSRFEDKEETSFPAIVEKDAIIALAGQSGWTDREGFYFSFFDRKERRWVNPTMFIAPMPDSRPPVIQSVLLKNSEGRTINPSQVRNLNQGRYTLQVQVTDTLLGTGENPLAPDRIVCSVNGIEVGALAFETYSARDGSLLMYRNGLVSVKGIYAPFPAVEVGEAWFNRGQATLEVVAQDVSGNVRSVTYRLQVD
jgi:hypothetical protein